MNLLSFSIAEKQFYSNSVGPFSTCFAETVALTVVIDPAKLEISTVCSM